jgi:MtrB/PioB family decaheme-associated outer membrane protein
MALWPDSQAHQFYLGGNYRLLPTTLLNFKYSYTHATQDEGFSGMGLTGAPAGVSSLNGVVNTTKAQVGFSSRPMQKLHLHGDLSYWGQRNKTPVQTYNLDASGATWTNNPLSPNRFNAKIDADYRLPYNLLLVGGLTYERNNMGAFVPTDSIGGVGLIREKTKTTGYRAELRKTMSETFTGSLALVREVRKGDSDYLKPNALPLTGATPVDPTCGGAPGCGYAINNQIPFTMLDMHRDKARFSGNWNPTEKLSLSAYLDTGRDLFTGPTASGLRHNNMYNFSLDASYQVSENWRVNAYASDGERALLTGHSSDYDALYKDTSTTFGVGFSGTPFGSLKVGGDLMALRDVLKYHETPRAGISGANLTLLNTVGDLPDVKYSMLRLKLYGEYQLNKSALVRVNYIYNRTFFNEWTYDGVNNGFPFLFSDNTTITAKQTQSVNFIGAAYVYKFQ